MGYSILAQHCGPTAAAAVVRNARQLTSRDPTFAPQTPAPSPRKQPSHISVSGLPQARVSYGGMYPGRGGQMSSTGADDGGSYSHGPPLNINGLHLGTL